MPLIMEEGLDVDDLFGDAATLELGLPAPQPAKGLAQRLDEMRLLGCCQKLAWSRLGCIAYISQDARQVNVRHLMCNPSDGKWILSDDYPLPQIADAHGGQPMIHLSWNENGADLAVADVSGRVSIFSISMALNNIVINRQATLDQSDDGAQIVGMMWLNANRAVHAFGQAAKLNGRWGYSPFRRRPIGPFHPASKAALVCVTRGGLMKLLYQNPDNRWAEISAELKTTAYSDRILTHAAIAASPPTAPAMPGGGNNKEPGSILVATHSACENISLYRVFISWSPPVWDQNQLRQPSGTHAFPVPTFRIVHNKIEKPSRVFTPNKSQNECGEELPSDVNALYSLTRLDIVPGPSESTGGATTGPWILAVYSSQTHAVGPELSQQGTPASVIARWQLEATTLSLHPVFEEVVSKKATVQAKTKQELRRLDDINSDRYVISIDHIELGNVLAITYDDSSIAFYDPRTMASFNGIDDTNTVTSLAQAGFNYPLDASEIHICFSPSSCLAVVLDGEWQMRLRSMEHSFGAEEGLYDESKFSAGIAALALAFCRACGGDLNTDDILMIILRQLSGDTHNAFLSEVFRALPVNCNFTVEQEKLMRHPYIPRCLSLQAALGFKNYYTPRTLPSSVAWAILNLQHVSVLFAYFFTYNKTSKEEPHDHDVLRMVYGNTKWALDFAHFILDELFELANEFEPLFNDQEAFAQKVKSTNSLALTLLLSSMSRAFLRFNCRGLRGVYASHTASPLTGDSLMYYSEICQMMDKSPVRTDVYEKFLAGVDSAIRHAYQGAGFGDNERPAPEKELLLNGRIPAVLVPAVSTLLKQTVPALKAEVDQMSVYLTDYSWLGFRNDRRTEYYRRTREIDIVKKLPLRTFNLNGLPADTTNPGGQEDELVKETSLPAGQSRRRCVRCCEISGDVASPRSVLWFRLIVRMQLVRSCMCAGMWTVESGANALSPPGQQQQQSVVAGRENHANGTTTAVGASS